MRRTIEKAKDITASLAKDSVKDVVIDLHVKAKKKDAEAEAKL